MKIIIIIPAYNEEASIGKVMAKCKELYGGIPLVIDDGSTDKTYDIAKAFGGLVIQHPYNRGLGAATRTGLQRAYELGADIVIKIDADYQHDPEDIKKVFQPIAKDRADVVFGSRFMGGLKYKMPLYRKLGNIFFSFLTSKLTGLKVTDGQTGLMAFSKRYLKDMNIISDYNETQQLIIDAWSKHMRIIEVPVVFNPRTTGKSFISFKYPFKVLPTLLRFLVTVNPLKIFLPLGFLLIVLGLICMGLVFIGYTQVVGKIGTAILIIGGLQVIMLGLLADAVSNKR
jgi:glycosyltransferase involved in cell wall biosynthesis